MIAGLGLGLIGRNRVVLLKYPQEVVDRDRSKEMKVGVTR